MNPKPKESGTLQRWWTVRVLARAIFLKQRLQRAASCYVTCPGNQDGLGAQLQCRLSGMLFAECQGLRYAHSPFTAFDFTSANNPDWPAKWERFLGIGAGEPLAADVARELGEPRRVINPTQIRKIGNTFWSVPGCHEYADLYPHQYLRLTGRFATRYAAAPKDGCVPHYTSGAVNVAIHLRRGGDLSHKLHLRSDDSFTAMLLKNLLSAFPGSGKNVILRVFSQGETKDFPALLPFGVEFHLNEDLFATLHSLIKADVLVMAKSSLSYSAALLSQGVKIYTPPWWHQPLPGWLVAGKNGSLDYEQLTRALRSTQNVETTHIASEAERHL